MTSWRVIEADCVEAMAAMPEASVDAVVTDPPAGIGFMGREWDHDRGGMDAWIDWMTDVMREVLRVAKPGAHALVWALPRTSHWTGLALERAGWDVRDVVTHLFGSGFPKSFNLPDGQGTALKPAAEFWFLARKPLAGTVSQTVLEHGTGALNVDGCRIGMDPGYSYPNGAGGSTFSIGEGNDGTRTEPAESNTLGRWPANVVLDESSARALDEQTGERRSAGEYVKGARGGANDFQGPASINIDGVTAAQYADSGGASRFFYVAKASSAERNAGLEGFEEREGVGVRYTTMAGDGRVNPEVKTVARANGHPTVKPIALMRWLVRLVTPPGGLVLDPFTGSGTTGCAAVLEGVRFVGIERETEYAEIARARIAWWAEHPEGVELVDRLDAEQTRRAVADAGQLQMFGKVA